MTLGQETRWAHSTMLPEPTRVGVKDMTVSWWVGHQSDNQHYSDHNRIPTTPASHNVIIVRTVLVETVLESVISLMNLPRRSADHFFHFSMYVNLVIGRPLTPHVPMPTRPEVESGVAKMLLRTRPLLVFANTYQHRQTERHQDRRTDIHPHRQTTTDRQQHKQRDFPWPRPHFMTFRASKT